MRSLSALVSLALGAALLATAVGGPAWAAKGDRKDQRRQPAEDPAPAAAIGTVKGDRYRVGKAKVAGNLTRIRDAAGDQLTVDGAPVADAPAWTDISAVSTAPFRFSRKMLRSVQNAFPRGSRNAFYGPDADWSVGDTGRFITVELAEARPDDVISQLVEVGFDGATAGPVQVGSATDTRAGVEVFTLGGRFSDGSEVAGATDVSGRAPGDPIDFYNARSGVFGVYDRGKKIYNILLPVPRDARSVTVSLRSTTDQGDIIDRLELPGGGHLVPLSDPGLGFKAADGAMPLGCRAIATFSSGSAAADGAIGAAATTMIRYTAGAGVDAEAAAPTDASELLAALDGIETIPMQLQRLDEDAEPIEVDGRVSLAPALGTFSLTMDVPAGQWSFAPTDGEELVTPAGESLIDHSTLTGRAGVRTGEGLDGLVSGDPDCGHWNVGVGTCELVPGAAMAALVPTDGSGLEQADITQRDGSAWCVGRIPDTRDAKYIVRVGRDYATVADLEAAVEASGCAATPVELGRVGMALDCAEQGSFERYLMLVAPQATADRDADGGILVSADMVVDPARPAGERYDGAAALEVFGGIVDGLAAATTPGGTVATTPGETAATNPGGTEAQPEGAAS